MKKRTLHIALLSLIGIFCLPALVLAQDSLIFKGVKSNMRYDDGETTHSEYLGWDEETGKAIFSGDQGIWKLRLNTADNKVTPSLYHYDNLMYGNSGSFYIKGDVWTIYSRLNDEDKAEFVVRHWNAYTGELMMQTDEEGNEVTERIMPKEANLESRGLAYNPTDGKVYGLFYFTDVALPVDIDSLDQEDKEEGYTTDAGYALATIDLNTLKITQITPGVYYDNFVFLAISPEGRIFSMTSGGTLVEFDAATGLMITKKETDEEGNTYQTSVFEHSGVQTQFKRQAACFDYLTGRLYWNGFINSGMGYNEWGSYTTLPDSEWRTNGKYDTALYEIDINTGKATRLDLIKDRLSLSCMWIEGRDATDNGIDNLQNESNLTGATQVYNMQGMCIYSGNEEGMNLQSGMYIVRQGNNSKKIMVK